MSHSRGSQSGTCHKHYNNMSRSPLLQRRHAEDSDNELPEPVYQCARVHNACLNLDIGQRPYDDRSPEQYCKKTRSEVRLSSSQESMMQNNSSTPPMRRNIQNSCGSSPSGSKDSTRVHQYERASPDESISSRHEKLNTLTSQSRYIPQHAAEHGVEQQNKTYGYYTAQHTHYHDHRTSDKYSRAIKNWHPRSERGQQEYYGHQYRNPEASSLEGNSDHNIRCSMLFPSKIIFRFNPCHRHANFQQPTTGSHSPIAS